MGELHCPYCGTVISSDFLFCPSCGSKLESVKKIVSQGVQGADSSEEPTQTVLICETCGYHNPVSSRSCESCGSLLKNAEPVALSKSDAGLRSQSAANLSVPTVASEQRRTQHKAEEVKRRRSKNEKQERSRGFRLETYQIIAIVAAIFLGGLLVYGLITSKKENNQAVVSQTQNANQAKANIMQEIDRLRQVVDKNPSDLSSTLRLANMLQDNQFFDQAIVYYKRYLDKNPQDVDARIDYGVTLFEGGNADGGIGEIEAALKLDPKHQIGYYNLGIIYLNQGKFDEANEEFKKCVSIDPNSDIGKQAEQILQQHANLNKSQEVK